MKIYIRFSIKKWFKVNKISLRLTINEPSSNQKSNPRELQYMNILEALAYHDRAMFETFRQLELLQHQPLSSFIRLIWLVFPLRFVFCLNH